jgi:Tryptophan halogenase
VSSRVLQRLMDDRAKYNLDTQIVHLFRTYVSGSHGPNPWMRRKGGNGFAYQGFNYPKSVWGGQLKAKMRHLEGDRRAKEYKLMGGTNTPYRRRWQQQMNQGRAGNWYNVLAGTVEQMKVRDDGMVVSMVKTSQGQGGEIAADFVIDCTGLEADVSEHRVLNDLLEHSGAGRNPVGRLDVERTFELRGTSSNPGVIYASGAATLGGYFPGVDTFLGLQIAAQEITDDLARRGFCRKIGPGRSVQQWLRWARNRQP